jgi:hypothetical protein
VLSNRFPPLVPVGIIRDISESWYPFLFLRSVSWGASVAGGSVSCTRVPFGRGGFGKGGAVIAGDPWGLSRVGVR